LVDSAENSRLADAYSILSAQALTCINRLEIAVPSGTEVVDDHQELVDLIARGEREPLLEALADHLSVAASHLTAPPPRASAAGEPTV
jgi:DNA-binding GntR family transcriptional regulator